MNLKFIAVLVAFVFILNVSLVDAQTTEFISLSGIENSNAKTSDPFLTKVFSGNSDMATFVNAMFRAAIALGAMLAVLQLARAGFLYMGSDMWHKKEQAKHLMQDAIIGLLVLMAVWLVLNQINPHILNLDVLRGVSNSSITSPTPNATPK